MKIELSKNEIELLSRILIEFRGREGIKLDLALNILYCKINGTKNTNKAIKDFTKKKFKYYSNSFKLPSIKELQKAEKLIELIIRENNG